MKVSVILPTLNEAGCIEKVIGEIPRNGVDEIIVVDAYSTDGTADIVNNIDGVRLAKLLGLKLPRVPKKQGKLLLLQ